MNKLRTRSAVALILLPLGCLWGCSSFSMPAVGVVPIDGLDQPLAAGVEPALDIQNHRGSVTVVVDATAPGPSVTALPHASGRVPAEVRWTAAAMQEDNGRPVLRVLSTPADTGAPDVPVDLTIVVPSCGGVRVQNDAGPVVLRNVSGAVEVHTSLLANDGRAILVETDEPLTAPMLLRSQRGSVEVRMGRGSAGQLTASTRRGMVMVDAGRAKLAGVKASSRSWAGTVNGGASDQQIDVERGDVVVRVGMPDLVRLPDVPWLEPD